MLRIRTPQLGAGGASVVTLSGGAADAADTGAGNLAVLVLLSGGATDAADTGAGTLSPIVALGGGATDAADTGAGDVAVLVVLSGGAADDADAGDGQLYGVRTFSGGATDDPDTGAGTLDVVSDTEAFPRGGFLPDDWDERERRRKAIRATLEGVARPKPAQVAQEMREAVAPATEPPAATLRDAVSPATMEGLRRLAESARARQASLDDDDEDVLMLLGV